MELVNRCCFTGAELSGLDTRKFVTHIYPLSDAINFYMSEESVLYQSAQLRRSCN